MIEPDPEEIAAILAGTAKAPEVTGGFCDCHVHVLGPADRYPPAAGFDVEGLEDFSVEAYREARARLGNDRVVLVQPEHHGTDHACLIDAMDDLVKDEDGGSRDIVRGVAAVGSDVEDRELEHLMSVGITGTRLVMHRGAESHEWETVDRLAWRVHDFGWDVELEINGSDLHEVEQRLREWPGRIVLDHIGLFLRTKTLTQRGFKALTRLIDRDKVWVKLSAPYLTSRRGRLDDPEVNQIARALIDWAPERMIWGSNWPHVSKAEDRQDDEALLAQLANWVPEETRRHRILQDNPMELYGFSLETAAVNSEPSEPGLAHS
jgi:D-galactarolactone isomerase